MFVNFNIKKKIGAAIIRCRKALSNIIRRIEKTSPIFTKIKKKRWNSFWTSFFNQIKFSIWCMTHCQQPHLFALYAFGTWHIVSSVASFFWGLNTLSVVFFPFFDAWKFLSSFFSSLTYGNFSAVFFFYLLCLQCSFYMVWNIWRV